MIQREVADLLQNDFHESSQSLVTVTNVRVTKDLGIAYVNVSVLGNDDAQRKAAIERIQGQTVAIRQALAGRVRHQFRRVPDLRFFLDDTAQKAERMEDIFAKIRAERGDEEE